MELDVIYTFSNWSVRCRVRDNDPDKLELDFTPNNPTMTANELTDFITKLHRILSISWNVN